MICPLAESYAREAGSAADVAASRKKQKYAEFDNRYLFQPADCSGDLGVFNSSANSLLKKLA